MGVAADVGLFATVLGFSFSILQWEDAGFLGKLKATKAAHCSMFKLWVSSAKSRNQLAQQGWCRDSRLGCPSSGAQSLFVAIRKKRNGQNDACWLQDTPQTNPQTHTPARHHRTIPNGR